MADKDTTPAPEAEAEAEATPTPAPAPAEAPAEPAATDTELGEEIEDYGAEPRPDDKAVEAEQAAKMAEFLDKEFAPPTDGAKPKPEPAPADSAGAPAPTPAPAASAPPAPTPAAGTLPPPPTPPQPPAAPATGQTPQPVALTPEHLELFRQMQAAMQPQLSPAEQSAAAAKLQEEREKQALAQWESEYQLNPEQLEELAREPEKVLPRLLSQVRLDAAKAYGQGMQTQLPKIVEQMVNQYQAEAQAEERFYQYWNQYGYDLRPHRDALVKHTAAYKQVSPDADEAHLFYTVGTSVIAALGVAQGEVKANGAQGTPTPTPVPLATGRTAAKQPAAPGSVTLEDVVEAVYDGADY